MKTSKTNTKSKNPSGKKSEKGSEVNDVKTLPNEQHIREKAEEIYFQRVERGEHGTAENDWLEAEAYFSESED
jgi:hypothetical protein